MKGDYILTGATGLVGGEIAWRLMRAGWRVWCVVRSSTYAEAASRIEKRLSLSGQECDWNRIIALPGNVENDYFGLDVHILKHLRDNCDGIIHCAADTSFAQNNRCIKINLTGAKNAIAVCENIGERAKLVYMSSAIVCLKPENSVVDEETPPGGFSNNYAISKRLCEELILKAKASAVIFRPNIVLSCGIQSRDFAKSILWIFPLLRELGILPMSGQERVDAVSADFVAEAVVRLLERPLPHRLYHLSAGRESSVSWRELLDSFTKTGLDYSRVVFDPAVNWKEYKRYNSKVQRLKKMVDYYLPFMRAGMVYDNSRLRNAMGADFPLCPKPTEYCAQLLSLFSEREAYAEALNP